MRESVAPIEMVASYKKMIDKEDEYNKNRIQAKVNNEKAKISLCDLNEFAKRHARKLQILHNPVLLHHIDIEKSAPIL
jgi:hypothetical protein